MIFIIILIINYDLDIILFFLSHFQILYLIRFIIISNNKNDFPYVSSSIKFLYIYFY